MKIALLLSGNLGFECLKQFEPRDSIICIFTNKLSISIIKWAEQHNIPLFSGNPREGKAAEFISKHQPDILFSINYLFLLQDDLISWPKKYALNIHDSLLPKYRGRTPNVWAIINGETETGATIHLIDKGCDTGDMILQQKISIDENMTGADILTILYGLYPKMIRQVLQQIEESSISAVPQDNSKATYFSVRTPESGHINWNWQKQRIRNWIRAQADPYPQAFTYHNKEKIKVNRISFIEDGFNGDDPNGLVLAIKNGKPVIKTPNGAVQLEEFSVVNNLQIEPGITLT